MSNSYDKKSKKSIDKYIDEIGNYSNSNTDNSENTTTDKKVGQNKIVNNIEKSSENQESTNDKELQAVELNKTLKSKEEIEQSSDVVAPNKKKLGIIITICIFCTILLAMGGAFAYYSMPLSAQQKQNLLKNGKFIQGITVFNEDVSGLTIIQAREKLSNKVDFDEDKELFKLKIKDEIVSVLAKDLSTENTIDIVLEDAMLYGRTGNAFNKFTVIQNAKKYGKNFDVSINTDKNELNKLVQTIIEQYSVEAKDADIVIDTSSSEKFTYVEEQSGVKIIADGLAEKIEESVQEGSLEPIEVKYEETSANITLEALKQNFTLRSTYSTNVAGTASRKSNVRLAGNLINGKKVMPGETFDIESELGQRTAANGWKKAGEFVNGELVDGYGGGICQASTTLFNAVIRADLEIVQRSNHSQVVSYVPLGFDAAISKGGPLFIFKNNTEYPIYIFTSGDSNKLNIDIYGSKLQYGDVTYEEQYTITGTSQGTMRTIQDPTLPAGKTVVVTNPTNGKTVSSVLIFKDSTGKEVNRRTWTSKYRAKSGEKRVGTGTTQTATQQTTQETATQTSETP